MDCYRPEEVNLRVLFLLYRKLLALCSRAQKCIFIWCCLPGLVQPTGCFLQHKSPEHNIRGFNNLIYIKLLGNNRAQKCAFIWCCLYFVQFVQLFNLFCTLVAVENVFRPFTVNVDKTLELFVLDCKAVNYSL